MDSDVPGQLEIENELRHVQKYAKLKASNEWLTWWKQEYAGFLDNIQDTNDAYEKYNHDISESLHKINSKLPELREQHSNLKSILETEKKKREVASVNEESSKKLQRETEQQNEALQSYREKLGKLKKILEEKKARVTALKAKKATIDSVSSLLTIKNTIYSPFL